MSALALSVLLSLVSAFAYAGGAIVQERVAESSPGEQYAPLRRPGWWAAVALNGLGGLLHVVALAYGPLSLVQPLGALTIVVALPMAALFVGRKAGATAWRGAIMATVGLAGLLSLVAASDAQSLDTAERVAVALVTASVVVALMIAGRAAHRHPAVRSTLLATASGIAFGMSSVFTKTVAVDWTGGVSAADVPSLAVIGVLATAGMLLSQASYRGAGLAAPLATLTVVNPVVAAAVGITMFGETFRYGTTGTALALSCGVVAAGGLILLTTERLTHAQPERAGAAGPEVAGLEVAGTGLVPADTALGATGMLPGPAGEPAGSVRGPLETVGAESGRVGALTETVGAESGRVGTLTETVSAGSGRVGTLAGAVGGPPGSGGELSGSVDSLLPETVESLLPETVDSLFPEPVGASLPETVGEPPVAVAAPSRATGGGAGDPGGAGRGASGDVPVTVPAVAGAVAGEAEAGPDGAYESGERPLSYAAFYGIPYVAMPTVDRHRRRIRS
ncbi:DMT family transporter [Streptomyces sp. HP-A2021]|uniref:DMT family transporter n=1 Tax=Streptomyces sp. HP-A2021 TaxID=2927875 RepID=UPI001FB03F64|nr:DMT family transporter [Streptomyces sp. HP-A2021]UOB08678.1 DMT family transporter [Streptomyces sp. HP-A2021]